MKTIPTQKLTQADKLIFPRFLFELQLGGAEKFLTQLRMDSKEKIK